MPHHNDGVMKETLKGRVEQATNLSIVSDTVGKLLAGDSAGAEKEIASLAPASPGGKRKGPAFQKRAMKKLEEETGVSFDKVGRAVMVNPDVTRLVNEALQRLALKPDATDAEIEAAGKANDRDYRLFMAAINASAKAKAVPQQNVQVNVDRRGIAVNGMRAVSSEPSSVRDPQKPRPTIHYFDSHPGTASKSPSRPPEEPT